MNKLLLSLVLIMVLVLLGGFLGYSMYQSALTTDLPLTEPVSLQIPAGSSADQIISELEAKGLVKNKQVLLVYLKLNPDIASGIKAGTFNIEPGTNLEELLAILQDPSTDRTDISVLIQEGLRYDEIATILENAFKDLPESKFSRAEYMDIAVNPDLAELSPAAGEFLTKNKPAGKNLEGFLYPETYFFAKDATAAAIVSKQITTLSEQISAEDQAAIDSGDYSFYELLNVASMIEREAFTSEEKPDIADVIFKRLEQGVQGVKLLQIDATLLYQAKDWEANPFLEKSKDGPYNTYTRSGLPPTPISNPGVDSIRAAIYPKSNPYYFYIHAADGSIYFATTQAQHNANVAKYLNN